MTTIVPLAVQKIITSPFVGTITVRRPNDVDAVHEHASCGVLPSGALMIFVGDDLVCSYSACGWLEMRREPTA